MPRIAGCVRAVCIERPMGGGQKLGRDRKGAGKNTGRDSPEGQPPDKTPTPPWLSRNSGGMAANGRLREKLTAAAVGKAVFFPQRSLCMDNAAMIGSLGEDLYRRGHRSDISLGAHPNLEVVTC